MAVMLLAHYEVEGTDRFLDAFDRFGETRAKAGATTHGLVRSLEDPRRMVALIEFPTRAAAEDFATSPERARALADGGVLSRTDELLEILRPAAAVAA